MKDTKFLKFFDNSSLKDVFRSDHLDVSFIKPFQSVKVSIEFSYTDLINLAEYAYCEGLTIDEYLKKLICN